MPIEELLFSCPPRAWKTEQVVVFDWHDGPREGIAALAIPKCEFVFEVLDERPNPTTLDDRLFRIRELPIGSVRSVAAQLGEPSKPMWAPDWKFASEGEALAAEHAVEAVLAQAKDTALVVFTPDMNDFRGVWAVQDDQWEQTDWFDFLGIPRSPDAPINGT